MSDSNSVVFVDSQVQNSDDLLSGLSTTADVHYLGNSRDGIEQINEILAQYQNLDAVYIFSHGSEGSLDLGTTVLNLENLHDYQQELTGWSQALSENADLLFFGCNVAQGDRGQAFVQQLDELTGADIAASTDLTGHVSLGGDWTLEAATGTIESYLPFVTDSLTNYQGTLASLSGSLTGTQNFFDGQVLDDVTVDGDLFLDGDVSLNVDDFILGGGFRISGNAQGARDSLLINAAGKVTIAGDIFGGGLHNITINANEIEIQGTSLISTRFIEGTDYDGDVSIGDSGNLTLKVDKAVAIQPGAQLFTHVGNDDTEIAGNIEITALDQTLQTNLLAFPTQPNRFASIDIDGAIIKGNDVTVSASGLDPKLFGDVVDTGDVQFLDRMLIDPFIERSASFLQGLVLPASVEVRISHAEATVTGSTIEASGAVKISTEATADGSVRSVRATRTPQDPTSKNPVLDPLSHFAVAVSYAETDAVTNVTGTTINAGSDVSLTSNIKTAAAANARLFGNLQAFGQGASKENLGLAAAVARTDTTSKVLLDQDSSVTSGGNVEITSGGNVASGAKAINANFVTGTSANSIAVNSDETDVETLVHGDITAAGRLTTEDILIQSDRVNIADDTISFDTPHGFKDGDTVAYQNTGNGSDITGLVNGQPYVVHVEDDHTIKLSRGAALDVDAQGVNDGAMHSLSRLETRTITQVNVDTDRITLENHGLLTGQQVVYRSNADEDNGIVGLFESAAYVVRVIDENTLELVGDLDQLAAGEKIDIESSGDSANSYELDYYEQEILVQTFAPTTVVDTDADTLTLSNHGFYHGQLVRYDSSSGEIGGLEDEQYYFVIVKDSHTIQLAASLLGVDAETAIDLNALGSGNDHQLTGIQNTTRFEAKTAVDSGSDVFTVNSHGFKTGDAVVYETDASLTTAAAVAINRTFDPNQQVDLVNNTLSIAAQTLETGDKVIYQAAYALDADSTQNQAIGGLISNREYYLIKLDDNTVQLAASQAQALANEAVDLTALGTGALHTLLSETDETIQVEDREIRGLETAEVYYVSVIDAHRFRLTTTPEAAAKAEFIDFDGTDFSGDHRLQRQGASTPGITIEADLVASDRAIAEAQNLSTPRFRHYINNPDLLANAVFSGGGGLLNQAKAADILKGAVGPFADQPIGGENQVSVGLGVAVNLVDHTVRAEVGSDQSDKDGTDFDTMLNSEHNLHINSSIEQKVQTRAGGATGTSEIGSAGLAIGVSDYDNTAQSIVHGNAHLDAKHDIEVTSEVEYPFLFDTSNLDNLSDSEDGDLVANLGDSGQGDLSQQEQNLKLADIIGINAVDGLFGGNLLLAKTANTFANTKKLGKQGGGSLGGFNGTIVVNDYDNVSEAIIKSGAQINQNVDYQTEQQSVNVEADTDMTLVGLVGMLHMDLALDVALAARSKKDYQVAFNPWGTTAQNGVGASVFAELLDNQTVAKIERGAKVQTGTTGQGLRVDAEEDVLMIGLTQSGAQVEGLGLTGSGSGFRHNSDTIAQLESGVTVMGGPLSVEADSHAVRVNSALTLVKTENIGIGLAVALDESDRNVRAVIGDAKADDEVLAQYQSNANLTANTSIDVSGDIEVDAKTTGAVVSAALGFNSLSRTDSAQEDIDSPLSAITFFTNLDDLATSTEISLGNLLGVTGGVAGNVQTETAKAYIYEAQGNGDINAHDGGNLTVNSDNKTLTLAMGALLTAARPSGEAADFVEGNQNVFAATLGAAFNQVDHTTSAFIDGVEIDTNNLQVMANKERDQGSRTLAIGFTPSLTTSSSGQGDFTANVSGAVALNLINSTTESYADNSTLRVAGNTTFSAIDTSGYYAAGGALSLGVLNAISDYQGAATLGFGFGFNEINSTTQSYLNQSTLIGLDGVRNPNSHIRIEALSDFESIAVSLSGAISSNTGMNVTGDRFGLSAAVAGAASINQIDQNTVSAYVSDSTIDAVNHELTIEAEDSSHILAIGGGVSISAITQRDNPIALSVGASGAVNTFENTTIEAYLNQSTVEAKTVDLTALSTAESGAYAFIGAGAGASATPTSSFSGVFAGAGAGTGNYGSSHISAQVYDAQIYTGALTIHALDETRFKSYAIGLAVGAGVNSSASAITVGAGVAVALNEVRNDVHANIKGASTINHLGNNGQVDVDLQALSTPEIESVNVAGTVAVAGSSQGNLGLGIAAGVSVAQSTLSNTVTATVEEGSSIQNGGSVSVKALLGQENDTAPSTEEASNIQDNAAPSTLYTVGGSASLAAAWSQNLGGSLAVAASVARNNIVDNTILATINDSTVTANGDITVTADFSPAVDATNFGVAAGIGISSGNSSGIGLAGAGIGSYNTLTNNTTEASVTNGADVTSQAGDVTLKATDTTHLKAHGGTGSLAIGGTSGGLGLSAAIGAAVAKNELANTVKASINDATVTAYQDLSVEAQADNTIDALNIGVGAAGGVSGSTGLGAAGAGIGSYNTLSNTVAATLQGGAKATSETGSIDLTATDTSTIKADGGAGSLAFGGGSSSGGSLSIGVAIAQNTLENEIAATIDNATVTAAKDVVINAATQNADGSKSATIEAVSVGASVAGAIGSSGGVSLAGAGVGADNTISNTIEASIQNSQVTSETGKVSLDAHDQSKIDAQSYVVSISAAGGSSGAGALTIGVAKATNALSTQVDAFVGQEGDTPDSSRITAQALDVSATADTDIDANVVTAGVAIAIAVNPQSPIGIGASFSGVIADNKIDNTVKAAVLNGSTLDIADTIDVTASDTTTVDAHYGLGSGSFGVLAGAAIAFATTENSLNNTTQAYMKDVDWAGNDQPDVTIAATETAILTTDNQFASVGAGLFGLAGAGASSKTTINSTTEAYAKGDQDWSLGNLTITADSDTDSTVNVHGGSGSTGISAGASLATVVDNSEVTAYLDFNNSAELTAQDVTITASATPKATANALFVAVGGVGLAGAGTDATATINPTVSAYVGAGTTLYADNLTVQAEQAKPDDGDASVSAIATTGAGSGALSLGFTYADAQATGTVTAYIGNNAQIFATHDVTVAAINNSQQFAGKDGVANGGFSIGITGGELRADTHSDTTTEAYLGHHIALVAQNLTLNAEGENHAEVAGVTFGGAGLIAGRAGYAETHSTSTTRAYIGNGNGSDRLKVFNTVTLDADHTHTVDKDLVVGTGGLIAAGSGANATHTIHATVAAQLGNNLQIEAGDIQVDAHNTSRQLNPDETSLRSAAGSLGLSVAKLESRTDITHDTDVQVGNGATLRQHSPEPTAGIDLKAKNVIDVQETVKAEGYSGLSGGGVSKAEITIASDADINLGEGSLLDASGDININSHSHNQARTVSEVRTGAIISGARVDAKTHVTPHDTITLQDDAQVLSQGEVALTAGISGTDSSGAEDSDSRESSLVDATANMSILSLIPVPSGKAKAETIYDRTHTITVNDGAEIASAKDTRLFAHEGTPIVDEHGVTNTFYGGRTFDDDPTQIDTIGVTVDGTVRSRRVEEKTIRFEEKADGTIQAIHQAVVDGEVVQLGSTETLGAPPPDGVTLIQGASHQVLGVGRYADLADTPLSGLKVTAGYQAVLYTEANFQGDRIVITADTSSAQLASLSNQLGSLEIIHDPNAVIGYRYGDDTNHANQTHTPGPESTPEPPLDDMVTVTGTVGLRSDVTNIYVGDFNGDGKDDFIRQEKGWRDNDNNNTAQTYLSQGDGSFKRYSLSESFDLKGDSTKLHVGDFNGDGKDDFISQEDNNRRGAIFYSKGNGYFNEYTLTKDYALNRDVTNLYIGDFNGDGKDDFLRQEKGHWDNDSKNTANVFLSKGNTSFSKHNLPNELKGDLTNLYIGDFNGDGKDDFIRQEKGSWDDDSKNTANVFLSKGNGSFSKHDLSESFALKGDNTNLYIGDFNGDGQDDFIRQEKGSWDNDNSGTARVFLSNGNGSFSVHNLPESFALKGDLTNLYIGDFNGDGNDDLMRQAKIGGGKADIFLSNGDASFTKRDRTEAIKDILRGNQSALHLGDFNGDGYADVFQHIDGNDTGTIMQGFSKTALEAALEASAAEASFRAHFTPDAVGNTPTIEIEDTSLDLGEILVTGGYLNGTGTLDAAANSNLEILNNSRASLQVNDITVSDTGGGLYFNYAPLGTSEAATTAAINAAINSAHTGNGANFAAVNTLATDGRPQVTIQTIASTPTLIQLDGDINNRLGTIQANNAIGDTIVNGNLRAHTIDIVTGGSVIQGYISDSRHLGGTPESQWRQTAEASALADKKVYKGSSNGNSAIIGDNVFIAGQYINVNGTIQAGRANHSVVITDNTQFQQAVASFNQQYANDNSQHLFDFHPSGHGITTAGHDHKQVQLQWNARDQHIEAHNLDISGGYLELHGQIFSTGSGQLKALDGYAQIQIENNTDYDLKLNALTNNEVEGKIKITDTSRSGNSPYGFHVTEIERLGNTIHTTVNGALSAETTGRNTTYNPKANQVYRFETEQLRLETKYMRRKQKGTSLGNSFFRIVTSDETYEREDLTVINQDVVMLRGGSGQLVSDTNQNQLYRFKRLNQVTVNSWSEDQRYSGVYAASTRRHWDWEDFRQYKQLHRHSIDADRAIAISFIGHNDGIVTVQSDQSTVILDGILSNTGGDTTIEAQAISTTHEGALWSDAVTLIAQNDIDLTLQGSGDGGTVEATTTNGDLNLTYLSSVVNEATLTAQNGDIAFTANAGIQNGSFTGNHINLDAIAGAITATVNTGTSATAGLTATAQGEIHLTGTPQIDQVASAAGIYFNGEFQGTLLNGQTTVEAEFQTLVNDFTAFASEAALEDHFAAIEAAKQAEYTQYWQIRNQAGDTFDPATYTFTYSDAQRADLQADGKTSAEIIALEQTVTDWMQARYWEFGGPAAYDENYTYQVSLDERNQLEATLSQTQQTWQTQIDLFGSYQDFQSFWATIYSDQAPSVVVPDVSSVVAGDGSQPGSSEPQEYQTYNETTREIISVNRDDLLAVITEEQKAAIEQAEANGYL